MAKKLQLRRGTTSQHSSFTGAVGEVTVDTDKDVVVVHDGSTAGGHPLAKAAGLAELIDEDNFSTDSATKAPSQQSTKAYIAATSQPLDADLTSLSNCQSGSAAALAALTSTEVAIIDGATVTTAELNILDGVTSTTAELNILDGVTSTAAELNILDGVTSTTAELNILDGVTSTTAELNLLDGVTATTAELNYTDGVTSSIQTQLNAKGSGDAVLATDFQQWTGTQKAAVKAYGSVGNFNIELDQGNLFTITLTGGSTLTFKKDSSTALSADCIGISGTIFLTNPANAQAMASHCKKASGVEIPATAGDYIIPFTVIAADKVLVDVIGPVS